MVRNELNSPTLKWLNEDDLHDTLIDIFTELKVLTGVILYDGSNLKLQLAVLTRFLMASPAFSGLTVNEIRHAFLLNNAGEFDEVHKHYNKELNAEYLGNVLLAYLRFKRRLYDRSGVFIRRMIDPPAVRPRVKVTDQDYMRYIQQDYAFYRAGEKDFIFGMDQKYKVLRRLGMIELYSRDYWIKVYSQAMARRFSYGKGFTTDAAEAEKRREVRRIYESYQVDGMLPVEEHHAIVSLIRQRRYMYFLECLAACGINDIFSEVQHKMK